MARIRSVKPELRTSLTAADWSREVRYFWVLLWGYLDDEGRGIDEPRLIKADCFPLDDDLVAADIGKWLDILATPRDDAPASVCRYTVNGRRYLHAPRWSDHQKPQHPRESKIPACNRSANCGRLHDEFMSPHEGVMNSHESLSGNGISNTPSPTSVGDKGVGEGEGVGEGSREPESSVSRRDDVERLCEHLAVRIVENGSNRPSITQKWRDAARLMLDRDGRSEDQIHAAIDWCQSDGFWQTNILSMPKLRDKYDQLRLQAQRGNGRASQNGSESTATQRAREAVEAGQRVQALIDQGGAQ